MIVIGLLLSNSKIQQKLKTLTNRVEEMWNGKEEPEQNSKENNNNKDLELLRNKSLITNLKAEISKNEFKLSEQLDVLESKDQKLSSLQKKLLDKNKAESNYNKIINDQKKEVSNLNTLISNLKEKINKLNSLLDVYEKKDKAEKIKNLQLKSTLNSALARRVEELQKFKSMFFGTVKEKIKNTALSIILIFKFT